MLDEDTVALLHLSFLILSSDLRGTHLIPSQPADPFPTDH